MSNQAFQIIVFNVVYFRLTLWKGDGDQKRWYKIKLLKYMVPKKCIGEEKVFWLQVYFGNSIRYSTFDFSNIGLFTNYYKMIMYFDS